MTTKKSLDDYLQEAIDKMKIEDDEDRRLTLIKDTHTTNGKS